MGYLSNFSLTIYDKDKEVVTEEYLEEIEIKLWDNFHIVLDEDNKWYDHQDDMTEFSKKYPDLHFYFVVYGQDVGDIWSSYFHNGKSYYKEAEIKIYSMDELGLI